MMIQPASPNSGTFAQRVEHKYWLPLVELNNTIRLLQSYIPVYRYSTSGWSSIRTVCLDTPDMRCYRDYLDGLAVRWKVRIRQYGDEGRFGNGCWVEIKMKNRGISSKRRFTCSLTDASLLVEGAALADRSIATQNEENSQVFLRISQLIREKRLRPKVRIDYERLSFQHSQEDRVRITLDRDLRFLSVSRQKTGGIQGLILEMKYNGVPPSWVKELANTISLHRAHRFSKYARAIETLDGANV